MTTKTNSYWMTPQTLGALIQEATQQTAVDVARSVAGSVAAETRRQCRQERDAAIKLATELFSKLLVDVLDLAAEHMDLLVACGDRGEREAIRNEYRHGLQSIKAKPAGTPPQGDTSKRGF